MFSSEGNHSFVETAMHDGNVGSPVKAFGQKGGIMQFLYLLSREGEAGRPPKISCPQYAGSCSLHSAIGKRIGSVDANRHYHQLRPQVPQFGGSECNRDVTPIDQGTLVFAGAPFLKQRESFNAILPSGAVIGYLPD